MGVIATKEQNLLMDNFISPHNGSK